MEEKVVYHSINDSFSKHYNQVVTLHDHYEEPLDNLFDKGVAIIVGMVNDVAIGDVCEELKEVQN